MNENANQNVSSLQQEPLTLLPIVLTDKNEIGKVLDCIEVSDISSKSSEIVLADLQNRRFTPLGVAVLKRVAESVTLYPCIIVKCSYKKHFEKREIVEERCLLWTKEDEYRVVPDGKERYKPMPNCNREKYDDVWDDETFLPLLANKNGEVAATCKETRLKCETCGGTGVLVETHYRTEREIAEGTKQRRVKCPDCGGRGLMGIHNKCERCKGEGYVTYVTRPEENYSTSSKCYQCDGTGKELGATILKASRQVEDKKELQCSFFYTSDRNMDENYETFVTCEVLDSDDEWRADEEGEWRKKITDAGEKSSSIPYVKNFEKTLLKVAYKSQKDCSGFMEEIRKLPIKEPGVINKIVDAYKEKIRIINMEYDSEHVACEDFEFEIKYALAWSNISIGSCGDIGCKQIAVKIDKKMLRDERCSNYSDALMLEDRGGNGFGQIFVIVEFVNHGIH